MIILDTCAYVWDALNHPKLSEKAKRHIRQAEQDKQLCICDITFWEVAMLVKKKRLVLDTTAQRFHQLALQARELRVFSIRPDIAELSVNFDSSINHDPADRIIAATAVIENASIITADHNLRASSMVSTVW